MPAQATNKISPLSDRLSGVLTGFTAWLDAYGETSWDHQSYYAGPMGGRTKALYYRHKLAGTVAVAPMVFSEAFFPSARRLFHHRMRLPIADAHYAMGFAFLHEATGKPAHLERAVHFLEVLKETRSPGFKEYCWGYPFDWVWRGGVIKAHTPLITTTPYVFEALLQVVEIVKRAGSQPNGPPSALRPLPFLLCPREQREEWRHILESIVRHATTDIKDFKFSESASTCSYTPDDTGGVVNASAYRATMLVSAAKFFGDDKMLKIANGNVNFVLAAQNADGSWPYAKDGVRDFVDHFHTCFVMKALAKIHALTGEQRILDALKRGVNYYLKNLFGDDGMPRPFSKAPRLTVYKCELYDCAECINLCLLLRKDFPQLEQHPGNRRRRNSCKLGQAGRLVPLAQADFRLGQCADAPLGPVADVPQPGFLCERSEGRGRRDGGQRTEDGGRKAGDNGWKCGNNHLRIWKREYSVSEICTFINWPLNCNRSCLKPRNRSQPRNGTP